VSGVLACEPGADFDLDRALAHGTLPGIHSEGDSALRAADLRSYADTYLREEIQAEALVRNPGGLTRPLDLMAASSGRILNVQAMCRQAGLGAEVDFVLEVGRDLWGIEVKAGRQVTRSMLRGLASLASRSDRVRRRIVVFPGERRQLLNGVEVLPLADFLEELPGWDGSRVGTTR